MPLRYWQELRHLIRRFSVCYRGIFLRVTPCFGEPVRRGKIQETSKNVPRYYTLNRLIRDLLFNLAGKMEKWSTYIYINCLSYLTNQRDARFRALDVRLLLIGQKRKFVKPVNQAKHRDFISTCRKTKME